MILTLTDTVQTTGGPSAPLGLIEEGAYLYGYNVYHNALLPVESKNTHTTQFLHSAMLLELSAKYEDGQSVYVTVPWDYHVLMADGDTLQAHELTTGTKLAYFTRIMRHEKYSAMRVVPFMKDRDLEHRWVWEVHSGMAIPDTHNIDHIDGDSYNNHFSNLRSLDIRSHSKMTAHRQRNRHTRRNADGSFAKGSSTTRVASANQPIPMHLSTGSLTNTCRVISMEETVLDSHYFTVEVPQLNDDYIVFGNILVQPGD
jgi:hypothetical protein